MRYLKLSIEDAEVKELMETGMSPEEANVFQRSWDVGL